MEKLNINPWILFLTHPKRAMQEILNYNPNHRIFILSSIVGINAILSFFTLLTIVKTWQFLIALAFVIIASPLIGYIAVSINSFFVFFIGKWFRGTGKYKEVRAAILWSYIPRIPFIVIWILFSGLVYFKMLNETSLSIFNIIIIITTLTILVWEFVIYINNLSVAHKFSIGRSILTIIISVIAFLVIAFIFSLLIKCSCSYLFDAPTIV